MAEIRIPKDLKERYDRCCNPDDEAYSAWECTLIERIGKLESEIERLTQLLSVSEDYRRAYQKGKYELYAMGGEICDAAAEHLPMSEGPLDRACRDALIAARAERKE